MIGRGRRTVHRHHVHVGQLLLRARFAMMVLRLGRLLLLLETAPLHGVVITGRREQVVRRRRRLGRVVAAAILVVPDTIDVAAQVTGVRQFDRASRVDRVAEEQLGTRNYEEEQHEAAECG